MYNGNFLNHQGTWSASVQYQAFPLSTSQFQAANIVTCPLVEYNNGLYYCTMDKIPTLGTVPTSDDAWILLLQA